MFTGFYANFFRFVSNFESYKHETAIVFNERFTFKKIRQPVSKNNRWLFLIKNSTVNADSQRPGQNKNQLQQKD